MTFVKRFLTVQLVIGAVATGSSAGQSGGTFTGPNGQSGNTLTVSGLRVWASISAAGQAQNATAQITIFGMTFQEMLAASTFSKWPAVQKDASVFLYAGNPGALSLVFSGTIVQAVGDFNAQPDTAFHIEARSGLSAQMTILPPTSVKGTVNAAALLQALAGQVSPPLAFENNSNVQVQLSNPHFKGSAMDQIRAICASGQINYFIENNTTLAIWPKGQTRNVGTQTITIAPDEGAVGYPTFGFGKIIVKCEYNPAIVYGMNVTVKSSLPPANGTFSIFQLDYELQAMTPGGAWFQTLTMAPPADSVSN